MTILPGETSEPFTAGATCSIQSEVEKLPLPPPELRVVFSPGGHINAKVINAPSLDVDTITTNFVDGDPIFPLRLT